MSPGVTVASNLRFLSRESTMSRAGAKKDGERVKWGKRHHEDFELGLGEGWTDSSEGETDVPSTSPTVKSPKRLCLSLKKRRDTSRGTGPSNSRVNDENRFSFFG